MAQETPPPTSPSSELEDVEKEEQNCVAQLRILIQDDPDLPTLCRELSESFLVLLIRARRNRPQVSLKLIKTLITFKKKQYPSLFTELNATAIQPVMENGMIRVVKRREGYTGPAIVVFRTTQWDTSLASMDMLIKAGFLYALQTTTLSTPDQERAGIIMLLEMGGFSFSHARECSYSNVTKMANCIIFGSPFRINSAFLVNSPYIFEKCWGAIKYAIPEFYRNFITVTTNDFTKLHSLVEPALLPESLGGLVPEDEGWENGLEDDIREGKGSQLVHELISAIERQEQEEKDKDLSSSEG